MTSRTKKPNISPIPETTNLKTTTELYKEFDEYMRNEEKKTKNFNEKIIAKKKINSVKSYAEKLRMIEEQDVDNPKEIDLKIKDLKELEDQIKEEIVIQEKRKTEFVNDIFDNGESLVLEIEEKRAKESVKTEKSIIKKLIDFLFGF